MAWHHNSNTHMQDWPSNKLLLLCEGAYIMTPHNEGTGNMPVSFEIKAEYKEVVLITGEARCLTSREKFTAPCVIPWTIKYLHMSKKSSRLLIIPTAAEGSQTPLHDIEFFNMHHKTLTEKVQGLAKSVYHFFYKHVSYKKVLTLFHSLNRRNRVSPVGSDVEPGTVCGENRDVGGDDNDGPENRDIGPENRDIGPENRDIGPQNRDIENQKRDIGPEKRPNRDTVLKNVDLVPKKRDTGPENRGVGFENDVEPGALAKTKAPAPLAQAPPSPRPRTPRAVITTTPRQSKDLEGTRSNQSWLLPLESSRESDCSSANGSSVPANNTRSHSLATDTSNNPTSTMSPSQQDLPTIGSSSVGPTPRFTPLAPLTVKRQSYPASENQ